MENKQKRFFGIIIRTAIGIILVFLLIWNVTTEKLINSLHNISFFYLLIALFYQYASIVLGSFNQYILLKAFLNLPCKIFFFAYFKAYALGLLLPGQFGDASIGLFLKSKGLNYSQTFSIYFLDKYLTFILYLSVLLLFFGDIMGYPKFMMILLWLALIFIMSITIYYYTLKFANSISIANRKGRLIRFISNLSSQSLYFAKHHPFLLLLNFFLTCIKLSFVILSYHAMLTAFGYSLSIWKVGLAALASGIVAYIPVSLHGLGTVEAVALLNFKTLGVNAPDVLSCYLLLRTGTYVFTFLACIFTFFSKHNKTADRVI
jgi:uncharacterized protein (TIRG00374 family)